MRRVGFTLIELVIVIGIMAVIVAVTAPLTIRSYQNQLVAETAQQLAETLRRAQSRATAARGDSPHGVKILSDGYVLFQGRSYATRVVAEDETTPIPSSITVSSTATEVVFSKLYATSSMVGTMSVIGAGGTIDVTVNAVGKIEAP
ncbi:prepilin-type N-terminal cleavage/methylation domain-containing protein [Patescibacteria group bacterium]|nr:prepilin-type N-terminal cleavage/methylation domain-containing protein [Patescibacteria group bacterium]MBU1448676.1 prepilin-type N-terminal cleavage/methylation domain-containing protein [Patescibacteria group bacterium]MBU2612856.1 prepilin-type N-terminal cleavage/methylation domain-containing protein [Patescibacteria group bacterium]